MKPDEDVALEAETARHPPHQLLAVVRNDPEVIAGPVRDPIGKFEFDVPGRAGDRIGLAPRPKLAIDDHAHRPCV